MNVMKEMKKKKYRVELNYNTDSNEPFGWTINYVDDVKEVFGKLVVTQYDNPCRGVTKSWIIPINYVNKISEMD